MPTSNTVTMTVNLDKTASLNRQNFGSQGEDIEITVVVPAGISGSGYDAYIDFIQPDGLAYFKGPYDCSSGTFSFFIGVLDSLMDKDGDLFWQFLLAETAGSVRTVKWSANRYKNPIYASVGATSSAILPYVPQMVYPDDYPASLISVEDAAGNWLGNDVEAVLGEVLLKCWPIGSIYIGVGSISPATLFGGTWSVFGAGKVLVGIDSGDADFDTIEETRGAKTVTLDSTMMPAHTHTSKLDGGVLPLDGPGAFTNGSAVRYQGAATYELGGSAGGGLAHNNIQPSIVVRMWRRDS